MVKRVGRKSDSDIPLMIYVAQNQAEEFMSSECNSVFCSSVYCNGEMDLDHNQEACTKLIHEDLQKLTGLSGKRIKQPHRLLHRAGGGNLLLTMRNALLGLF